MTSLAKRQLQQPSILCVSQGVLLLNLHNLGRGFHLSCRLPRSAASPQSNDNNSKFHLKLYFMLMN